VFVFPHISRVAVVGISYVELLVKAFPDAAQIDQLTLVPDGIIADRF
jgi:hypothetical protein